MAGSSSSTTLLQFRQTRNCPFVHGIGVSQAMERVQRVDAVDEPGIEQELECPRVQSAAPARLSLADRAENFIGADRRMPLRNDFEHPPPDRRELQLTLGAHLRRRASGA